MTAESEERTSVTLPVSRIDYGKFWAPSGSSDWETLATTDDVPPNSAFGYLKVFGLESNDRFSESEFIKKQIPPVTPATANEVIVPHAVAVALSRGVHIVCQTHLLNESFGGSNTSPVDRFTPQRELHIVRSKILALPLGSRLFSQHPTVYDMREIPEGMRYKRLGPAQEITIENKGPFRDYATSTKTDKRNFMLSAVEEIVKLLVDGKKVFFASKGLTVYERVLVAEEATRQLSLVSQLPLKEYRWATEPIHTRIYFETLVFGENEEYGIFGEGMELLQI